MKLDSNKYRKAAELIFEEKISFACHAINVVTMMRLGFTDEIYYKKFKKSFYDSKSKFFCNDVLWFGSHYEADNQLARQLALLFMAEIVDDKNGL